MFSARRCRAIEEWKLRNIFSLLISTCEISGFVFFLTPPKEICWARGFFLCALDESRRYQTVSGCVCRASVFVYISMFACCWSKESAKLKWKARSRIAFHVLSISGEEKNFVERTFFINGNCLQTNYVADQRKLGRIKLFSHYFWFW